MPIGLTDQQLELVKAAARHISPAARCQFLQAIANELRGCEIGDGAVGRAVKLALASADRWTRA